MGPAKCVLSTLLLIGISYVFPQEINLSDLIANTFKNDDLKDAKQSEKYKPCGKERECVPRFLCKDGEIITDGTGIIDVRVGGASYVINETNNLDSPWKKKQISSKDTPSEDTECGHLRNCCNLPKQSERKPIVTTLSPLKNRGCGYRNPNGVGYGIIGEEMPHKARFGEFPWMVAILCETEDLEGETYTFYECGGALIAPTVIVTAAHCVQNRAAHILKVRAGEWNIKTNDELLQHQNRRVREIILHEEFKNKSLFNDIALLIVDSPFDYAQHVRPICLPPPNTNFDFSRCYVTGWGKDSFGVEGKQQAVLKKFDVPIMPRNQCQSNLRTTRLGHYFNLHESFICAGGEIGKDACKKDGGSPLVCPIADKDGQFYQAGIVAWGIGCGKENIPGLYANVAYLRTWIDEKLSKLKIDFSHFTA